MLRFLQTSFGYNEHNQLGDSTTSLLRVTPLAVQDANNVLKGRTIIGITSGSSSQHTLLRTLSGRTNAVLNAPAVVGSCDTSVTLDASQSSTTVGNPLSFSWSAVGASDTLKQLLAKASQSTLVVPVTALLPNQANVFSVTVSNTFNASSTATVTVLTSSAAIPQVKLTTSSSILLKPSQASLTLATRASICTGEKLTHQWTQVEGAKLSIDAKTTTSSSLVLQSSLFPSAGVYRFNVVVTSASGRQGNSTVVISFEYDALVASIASGDRIISTKAGGVSLDGSASYDPSQVSTPATYSWTCAQVSGDATLLCPVALNTFVATVTTNTLVVPFQVAAGKYLFTLTYSKGSRSAFKSVTLTAVDYTPPKVTIGSVAPIVVASRKLSIAGSYVTTGSLQSVQWSVITGNADVILPKNLLSANGDSNLVIKPDVLTKGATYTFRLTVTDSNGIGYSQVTTTVGSAPTLGVIVGSGNATAFASHTVTTSQWITNSGPLNYIFYVQNGANQALPMTKVSSLNSATLVLPQSLSIDGTITIIARAIDQNDDFGEAKLVLPVTASTSTTQQALTNLMTSVASITDTEQLTQVAMAIVDLLPSNSSNIEHTNMRLKLFQSLIASYNARRINSIPLDTIQQQVSVLSHLISNNKQVSTEMIIPTLNLFSTYLNDGTVIDDVTLAQMVQVVNTLVEGMYLTKSSSLDQTSANNIRSSILPLISSMSLSTKLAKESPVDFTQASIAVIVQKTLLSALKSSSYAVNDGSVTITANTGSSETRIVVIQYAYNIYDNSVINSSVISVSSSASSMYNVTLQIPGSYDTKYAYQCVRWSGASRSTSACKTDATTTDTLTCTCSEMGDYAVQERKADTPLKEASTNTTLVVIIVVIILAITIVALAVTGIIIICIRCFKRALKPKFVDNMDESNWAQATDVGKENAHVYKRKNGRELEPIFLRRFSGDFLDAVMPKSPKSRRQYSPVKNEEIREDPHVPDNRRI
jgi:hypothetical protein